MLIFITVITLGFVLTLLYKGFKQSSKPYVINILIILIYNLAGWTYIDHYMNAGEESLLPGLLFISATILHLMILGIYYIFKVGKHEP